MRDKWSEKDNGKFRYFLITYSVLFVFASIFIFLQFIIDSRTLIWNSDASGQYLPNLYELYTNIIDFIKGLFSGNFQSLPQYSYNAGLGTDISTKYFTGIWEYLGVLLGRRNIELTFSLIILIRLYLSGISFGIMAFYFKNERKYVIPGALLYAFNGFTLYYGVRHYMFLIPVVLLPILIVGTHMVLNHKSPILFIVAVFYQAWTEYYFLYMCSIFIALFVLVYWGVHRRKLVACVSDLGRFVGYYLLGCLMAAVSLATKIAKLLSSSRTGEGVLPAVNLFYYGKSWIITTLTRLFSPYTTSGYAQYYMLYAITPVIILALIVLFRTKGKSFLLLKILFIVSIILLFVPLGAYIFSGFNSLVNRWCYGFTLLLAYILTKTLPYFKEHCKLVCIIGAVISVVWGVVLLLSDSVRELSTCIGYIVWLITLILYFVINWLNKNIVHYTSIVLVSVVLLGNLIYNPICGKFVSQFLETGQWTKAMDNSLYSTKNIIDDESFYRIEAESISQATANAQKIHDAKGVTLYDSVMDAELLKCSSELANSEQLTIGNFFGFNSRSVLDNLAGVKYFVTTSKYRSIPYGFKLMDRYKSDDGTQVLVYKNTKDVSLGKVYTETVRETEISNLSALEKQEILKDAVIVENAKLSMVDTKNVTSNIVELNYTVQSNSTKTFIKDGIINVNRADDNISLLFESPQYSEIYVSLEGISPDLVSNSSVSMGYKTKKAKGNIWLLNSQDKYKTENYQNYLFYIGSNYKNTLTKCKLSFLVPGEYSVSKISVYAVKRNIGTDKENESENRTYQEKVETDKISASIDTNEEGTLLLSIPYNKNWSVYIDGEKVETYVADYCWTGIDIGKGKHEILMKYSNRVCEVGAYISLIGIMMFLMFVVIRKTRNARNE